MKINALFVGGRCDGRLGVVYVEKFRVGMQIPYNGEYYTVQHGPAAAAFENTQSGHNYLAVRAVFEGTQPASANSEQTRFIEGE